MSTRKIKVYLNMSIETAKVFDSAVHNYDDYFTEELSEQLSDIIKSSGVDLDFIISRTARVIAKHFDEIEGEQDALP